MARNLHGDHRLDHHRRRPSGPGRLLAPPGEGTGPPGGGPRPHRPAMAQRTVGVAPHADAELDDPPSGRRLRRRRPRRVHGYARAGHPLRGLRHDVQRAGARTHAGRGRRLGPRRLRSARRRGALASRNVVVATGWADRPHVPDFADRLPARVQQLNVYGVPASGPDRRPTVCWSWARQRQAPRSPANSPGPAATSRWPSAAIAASPAATAIGTSCAGSTSSAPSTGSHATTQQRQLLLREPSLPLSADATLDLNTLGDAASP